MAQYSLFVLKVPLNTNQPTNQAELNILTNAQAYKEMLLNVQHFSEHLKLSHK